MDYDQTAPKIETLTADILRMGAMTRQSRNVIASSNLTAEVMADDIMGDLLYQLEAKMLSKQWEETCTEGPTVEKTERKSHKEYVPLTWFDHLKHDLLERWPLLSRCIAPASIRNRVITVEFVTNQHIVTKDVHKTFNVCPYVDLTGHERHYRFLEYGPSPTTYEDDQGSTHGTCECCNRPDVSRNVIYHRGKFERLCQRCEAGATFKLG